MSAIPAAPTEFDWRSDDAWTDDANIALTVHIIDREVTSLAEQAGAGHIHVDDLMTLRAAIRVLSRVVAEAKQEAA